MNNRSALFLDSGAYSAMSKGIDIDIDEYIGFIKKHERYLEVYACLDFIVGADSAEKTYSNQKYMESKGLHPLITFHKGESYSWLEKYISEYDYIALGGLAGKGDSIVSLRQHLDRCFEILCPPPTYLPVIKTHGFGITSLNLMLRYPWYSVDSTSWVHAGRFGSIIVPRKVNGEYNYLLQPWKVNVSFNSPSLSQQGKHILNYSPMERKVILRYIEERGYCLGKSEYRRVDSSYELQPGERWFGGEGVGHVQGTDDEYLQICSGDEKIVEYVLEPGICNAYNQRDELNILYFLDLEKSLPQYPVPFTALSRAKRGFGLR